METKKRRLYYIMETKLEKTIPAPVLAAQNVLAQMEEAERQKLTKRLPGYAMQLAKDGIEVTEEILREHVMSGFKPLKRKNTQSRDYVTIVAALPEEEFVEFENPVLEFRHYADKGDIRNIDRLIKQYKGVAIEGWGNDNIDYKELLEPAFITGNLELLKHAIENDPDLTQWWVVSECGHAMEKDHIHMVRYVVEDLGLGADLEKKYSENPYEMYVRGAIKHGYMEMAEYVLPKTFQDRFSGKEELFQDFFTSALESCRMDYVRKFIAMGIKASHFDEDGFSTISFRASTEAFKYLLEEADFFNDDQKWQLLMDDSIPFMLSAEKRKCLIKAVGSQERNFFERLKQKGSLLKAFRRAVTREFYTKAATLGEQAKLPKIFWGKKVRRGQVYVKQWQRMIGDVPEQAGEYNPRMIKKSVFDDVIAMMEKEGMTGYVAERYAYHAAALFCSTDRVLQYLEKWGTSEKQPLHDIIQNIDIPQPGPFNAKEWGDAVLQHGPAMAKLVVFADRITIPLKSSDNRQYSLAKTRAEAAKYVYKKGGENPRFAGLCKEAGWSEHYFNAGLKIISKYQRKYSANDNHKHKEKLPEIDIDGKEFGLSGHRFYKLADGDTRGLLLGEFTDCCQHLASAGAACAEHGFASENGGFYVVEDSNKKIVGQSWAWIGKDDELVFDSLEFLNGRVTVQNWELICRETASQIEQRSDDITSFRVGTGGKTPTLAFALAQNPAKPVDYTGYRDSGENQYMVWERVVYG